MSFEILVKKIAPTLKRITHRLNGRFTFFNEDDLYQEALLHLWLDFKEGKLVDKTESYVLQGCYFYLKNHIRKIKDKPKLVSLEELVNEGEEGRDYNEFLASEDPVLFRESLSKRMLVEVIRNNGFTPREKELMGFLAQDLTIRQIGQRLGISHVAVLKLRNKIKAKCRQYMDNL